MLVGEMPEIGQLRKSGRGGLLCLTLGVLTACGGNARAPVEDRTVRPAAEPVVQTLQRSRHYRVQPGDTLYSIAFRYGLDYRRVAAANDIPAPYVIYPGQEIRLREAALPARAPKPESAARAAGTKPETDQSSSAVGRERQTPGVDNVPTEPLGAVTHWRWPTSGPVIRGYSGSVHKGIDIGGRRDDPVHAVAPGVVVYAGAGIVGFGELLIVKHNEVYLSAYGHNDRLLVAEGRRVVAGQKIAEKGSSGTDRVKLHFEIRREGQPVDPQRLLPRR